MFGFSFLSVGALIAVLTVPPVRAAHGQIDATDPPDVPAVSAVRSIDPAQDDYTDLAPLAAAIGFSRVVMLGEASHGDGAAQAAKARIVRFLRAQLGFDVLIFETGLFEGYKMDRAFEEGLDLIESVPKGLPPFWARSGAVLPILDDAWSSYFYDRPLKVAGMAPELVGERSAVAWGRFAMDTLGEISPHPIAPARRRELLTVIERLGSAADLDNPEAMLLAMDDLGEIAEAVRDNRDALVQAIGPIPAQRLARIVHDRAWAAEAAFAGDVFPANEMATYNERAARMADNLAWLIDSVYPDQKIIVWCANWHLLADPAAIACDARPAAIAGAQTTFGLLPEAVREQVYTLATSSVDGLTGWPGGAAADVPRSPDDGLEAMVSEAGGMFAFAPLAGLPADHPMREPQAARLAGVSLAMRRLGDTDLVLRADWGAQVDGLLVIETMFPAAFDGKPPEGVPLTRPDVETEEGV